MEVAFSFLLQATVMLCPKGATIQRHMQSFISALWATMASKASKASSHDGNNRLIITFKPQLVHVKEYKLP